ncbi:MAG: hypothetical protein IJY16_01780, partial [Clostridia bacterium]|nr:hypothetical protein [Clostridia bacterium]
GLYAFAGCDTLSTVHFSNTNGWQFTVISTAGGIDLDVSDGAQNAAYLTDRYVEYYLNKKL